MQTRQIETDYLIIGAGAMSMAFADVIFHENPSARMVIVDRRAKPGGHWNDAYPFVRLHQPAAFYGVNSAPLGQGGAHLASRAEILAYFNCLMDRFVESGRVTFLPMTDYQGNGRVVSTMDSEHAVEVNASKRIVDGSYMNVEVPSTHPPRYAVDEGVPLVPPNGLVKIKTPWQKYVIIGAGKTSIDAILFLLDNGVNPDRIQWLVSNDMWLWNRGIVQPGMVAHELLKQVDAIINAREVDDIFLSLESQGSLFRLDKNVMPSKWRCATVAEDEFEALCRVKDVVRMGRVKRVGKEQIELTDGVINNHEHSLIVDCSANGLAARECRPVFAEGSITLQSVFMCQQVLSAAILARLELMSMSDEARNDLWKVVPHPETTNDMPVTLLRSIQNALDGSWKMPIWLRRSRLNLLSHESLTSFIASVIRVHGALPKAQASLERMQLTHE